LILPVSAPFHSSLLLPASDRLRQYLVDVAFSAPVIALINNVDVAVVSDVAAIKDALVRQAASPVRWVLQAASPTLSSAVPARYWRD
jgi:[acyl-carrier-protein] S-malonyltransferase